MVGMSPESVATESTVEVLTVEPTRRQPTLAEDVAAGFRRQPKSLPPKYFYDERGSALFDRICDTPEYYQTRTEDGLLSDCAEAVLQRARPDHVIELGSGTSRKTRRLLDACQRLGVAPRYWPFDVCREVVEQAGAELMAAYPWLGVTGLVGDYHAGLDALPAPPGRRLYVFLGGTLGNFPASESIAFLRELRGCMGDDDALLLGVDRVKPAGVLEAAYDDAAGITAAFNLNLLSVLNRELQADFPLESFSHRAVYNGTDAQIEMYLEARRDLQVRIDALNEVHTFHAGERMLTEISRKFTPRSIEHELAAAGFGVETAFEPADGYFSLVLARPRG
ncbi:L-histidine N(alpha)-methyltransferase [Ectothiorhodospiraceae bacterium WFHF3C12]|nr:L-histidine N(alpha)-methyltransferase [Ectothiorhodospiraceae bacterium WFHF3C12]